MNAWTPACGYKAVGRVYGFSVFTMISKSVLCWFVGVVLFGQTWGMPAVYQSDIISLPLVSELASHLGTNPSRLQEPRLPIPTLQDLETIRKVAEILVMLGQQVIPGIIGEPSPAPGASIFVGEGIPNDPVTLGKQQITS